MSRKARIKLLPSQNKFYKSTSLHSAYIGGFGSGKSHIGTFKTLSKKLQYPQHPVAYYLPTYPLIKDIAFPKFCEHLDNLQMDYTLNKTDKEILIPGRNKIIMRSMEDPYKIIGYEVAYSCIDEADVLPQEKMNEAFSKILGRNRSQLPKGHINITDLVGTPEGFKFIYQHFVKHTTDNRMLIKAKTSENPFLPDGYIATLTDSYTPAQLLAYLNGEFVNLTSGSVYKDFDRKDNHTPRMVKPHEKLHIGMDFNITNMNCVIHVIENDIKYAVDEITHAYDTMTMIRIIQDKYPDRSIVIYPDASGKNRNTSGKSDVNLLMEAGFTIRSPGKNPFVRDRVNALNKGFRDKSIMVNTHNCPEYTEALEKIAYNNNEPDKQSGFDHITDAGGYFAYIIGKVGFTI